MSHEDPEPLGTGERLLDPMEAIVAQSRIEAAQARQRKRRLWETAAFDRVLRAAGRLGALVTHYRLGDTPARVYFTTSAGVLFWVARP